MADNLDGQTIFNIPEVNLKKFEEMCAKLSKKAIKIGCSEIFPVVFGHHTEVLSDGVKHRVYEVLFTVEVPKIDGWQFVARIDHSNETGNVIRRVPNLSCEIPDEYRNCPPKCDHCNLKRQRRDSFLLHSDEGEFKMVGSSCLIDFFGHDPVKMAKMAELLGFAYEGAVGHGCEFLMGDHRWIGVETFAAASAWAVRTFGWVSGKAAYENPSLTSTRSRAFNRLFGSFSGDPIEDQDYKTARAALNWAESLKDKAEKSDYEHNICVVAGAEMMETRSVGLCASIVGVYIKNITAKATQTNSAISEYVGTEGERLKKVSATVIGHKSFEKDFGIVHLYSFRTTDNCIIKWFASVNAGLCEGQTVTLAGTVKKHDIYQGNKQTLLTRCKVVVEGVA